MIKTLFLLFLFLTASVYANDSINDSLSKALMLLEEGRVQEFIDAYVYPVDLEKIRTEKSPDQIITEFKDEKLVNMKDILKNALVTTPLLKNNGNSAEFVLEINKKKLVLKMEKIEDRWYIRN